MDTLRLWIGSGLAAFLILTSTWLRLRADEIVPNGTSQTSGTSGAETSSATPHASYKEDHAEEPASAPTLKGPAYRPYAFSGGYPSISDPASSGFVAGTSNQQGAFGPTFSETMPGQQPEFSVEREAGLPYPQASTETNRWVFPAQAGDIAMVNQFISRDTDGADVPVYLFADTRTDMTLTNTVNETKINQVLLTSDDIAYDVPTDGAVALNVVFTGETQTQELGLATVDMTADVQTQDEVDMPTPAPVPTLEDLSD